MRAIVSLSSFWLHTLTNVECPKYWFCFIIIKKLHSTIQHSNIFETLFVYFLREEGCLHFIIIRSQEHHGSISLKLEDICCLFFVSCLFSWWSRKNLGNKTGKLVVLWWCFSTTKYVGANSWPYNLLAFLEIITSLITFHISLEKFLCTSNMSKYLIMFWCKLSVVTVVITSA